MIQCVVFEVKLNPSMLPAFTQVFIAKLKMWCAHSGMILKKCTLDYGDLSYIMWWTLNCYKATSGSATFACSKRFHKLLSLNRECAVVG